jgi:hypothetical protein
MRLVTVVVLLCAVPLLVVRCEEGVAAGLQSIEVTLDALGGGVPSGAGPATGSMVRQQRVHGVSTWCTVHGVGWGRGWA